MKYNVIIANGKSPKYFIEKYVERELEKRRLEKERAKAQEGSHVNLEEFTYVDYIKLYVKNSLEDTKNSWEDVIVELSKRNSHLMTLSQWWFYYDWCAINNPGMFSEEIGKNSREYLDMRLEYKKLKYHEKHFIEGGKIEPGVSVKIRFEDISPTGFFDRRFINRFTGLPAKTGSEFSDFYFRSPLDINPGWRESFVLVRDVFINNFSFSLDNTPDGKPSKMFFRECKLEL